MDRSWRPGPELREHFERVASGLRLVRAGVAGVVALDPPAEADVGDVLFAQANRWRSRTPYRPTRHPSRAADVAAAVTQDLLRECLRRALPRPEVSVTKVEAGPRRGVKAEVELRFPVAVPGPIMLGRDAHAGGGLFAAATPAR